MSFYNWTIQNLVLPLSDVILGRSVSKHLRFLHGSQWWSSEELKEYQSERLRALIKPTYTNVPYYHDLFNEGQLTPDDIETTDDLLKLPLFT